MDKSGRSINAVNLHKISGISLAVLLLSGCVSDVFFSVMSESITLKPSGLKPPTVGLAPNAIAPAPLPKTCVGGVQTTLQDVRIMFMIDHSSSTDDTDPKLTWRVKTIQKFLEKYGSKPNFSYSFSYFNSTVKTYDVSNLTFYVGDVQNIFGSSGDLTQALARFSTIHSRSYTNYGAAFTGLKNFIDEDLAAGSKQKYVVIFMSDGQPTDLDNLLAHTPTPSISVSSSCQYQANIDANIEHLVSVLAPNSTKASLLTVSSVYFGAPGENRPLNTTTCQGGNSGNDITSAGIDWSISHLKKMAEVGGGQFLDTNQLDDSDFSIEDLITIPGQNCGT